MNQRKERKSRQASEQWAEFLQYEQRFREIETRWYYRMARRLFPNLMIKHDRKANEEFAAEFRRCKKRVAHASRRSV